MATTTSLPGGAVVPRVDHLVYAARDLDAARADLERRLGVHASVGGQHLGKGTHNALIAIGSTCYLEIIAPDPAQPPPSGPRWFGIDSVFSPRLIGWAAVGSDLPKLAAEAARRGIRLGAVTGGRRQRPDGVVLAWEVTDPNVILADGLVPFFIDWGSSPHPSSTAVRGPLLVALRGEHPEPSRVNELLALLDIPLPVTPAARPALVATFDTESGLVELR